MIRNDAKFLEEGESRKNNDQWFDLAESESSDYFPLPEPEKCFTPGIGEAQCYS
jgi:hypothetical protein